MQKPAHSPAELKDLLEKNTKLLEENNKLLHKIHRNDVWGFWIRIAWYSLIIGAPFAVYFYLLEPYFTSLGSDYELFKAGINEIPGLKGIGTVMDQLGGTNQ